MKKKLGRRSFLKSALAAGAFPLLPGCFSAKAYRANSKVRLACCGIGGMGGNDVRAFAETGLCDIVALCDVDLGAKHTQESLGKFPAAARFHDFREMFDRMADGFDAVTAGVPDHAHFPIVMRAIKEGKAVYTEKPMGHSFAEIQVMMDAERKYGAICQMGNQGHSRESRFQMRDYVKRGVIDPNQVSRIVTHMNSARRWHKWNAQVSKIPYSTQPLPATMTAKDWQTWLGTVPDDLPFSKDLHYGEWRSWFLFGNGALGDWGAHVFDSIHEYFDLGLPTEIAVRNVSGWNRFVFPMQGTVDFRFPAKGGRKALTIEWWEGDANRPDLPKGFVYKGWDGSIPKSGSQSFDDAKTQELRPGKEIYMADGTVWQGCSHDDPLIRVGRDAKDVPAYEAPVENHWANFLRAVRGETAVNSPFRVAGPLSQVFTLGCIAQRLNRTLAFDPATRRFVGDDEANALLAPPVRKGWESYYTI